MSRSLIKCFYPYKSVDFVGRFFRQKWCNAHERFHVFKTILQKCRTVSKNFDFMHEERKAEISLKIECRKNGPIIYEDLHFSIPPFFPAVFGFLLAKNSYCDFWFLTPQET